MPFDFYKQAYAINQSYGGALMATSSISMGDRTSYNGLAKNISLTNATGNTTITEYNYNLNNKNYGASPEYYLNKFSLTSSTDQQAQYLLGTSPGLPVPKVNNVIGLSWSGTCYPSALGDIRDHEPFDNLRDGAWVESGLESSGTLKNTINIYRADPASGNPLFINTIDVKVGWTGSSASFGTRNCRVFTSPGFVTGNLTGGSDSNPLIAFFGWDTLTTYYELFKWDLSSGTYGTLTSIYQYDLTSINTVYLEFPYIGKHDIFYLSPWVFGQTYTQDRDYLLILGGASSSGNVYQLDVTSGVLSIKNGDIANYSDVYDVILIGDNNTGRVSGTFYTYLSVITGTASDSQTIADLNAFDSDYNWQISPDYFFVGDDQQSLRGAILGRLIYFDSSGLFSTASYPTPTYFTNGVYSNPNYYTGRYILNRVVAVDFGKMVVGSGPGYSQPLFIASCIQNQGIGRGFYKSTYIELFSTTTENEDFIAMNHLLCEDWTGFFDGTGVYTSGREIDLLCGAGNQHILNVKGNMDVIASSKNYTSSSYYTTTYGSYSGQYNYIIYLGKSVWGDADTSPHTGKAYFYIAVSGISDGFRIPTSSQGDPAGFSSPIGGLQMLVFYA